MSVNEDIEKLKKKFVDPAFTEDKQTILAWERDVKKAQLRDDLANHDAMKEIIKKLEQDIKEIDDVLKKQEVNSDQDMLDRKALKYRRKLYFWFLNLFSSTKKTIKTIEKEIEQNL